MKNLLFSCTHEMLKNENNFKMKSHIWWIFYEIVSEQGMMKWSGISRDHEIIIISIYAFA